MCVEEGEIVTTGRENCVERNALAHYIALYDRKSF